MEISRIGLEQPDFILVKINEKLIETLSIKK